MSHAGRQEVARYDPPDVGHRDALGGQAVLDCLPQRALVPEREAVLPASQPLLLYSDADVAVEHERGREVVIGSAETQYPLRHVCPLPLTLPTGTRQDRNGWSS